MSKTFTPKKHVEFNLPPSGTVHRKLPEFNEDPPSIIIKNILNYSKSLCILKSVALGHFEMVLN